MKRILIALAAGVAMLTTSAKINDTQGFESDRAAFVADVGNEDSSEITSYGTRPGNVPYPLTLTYSGDKYLSFDTGDTTVWYSNTLDSAYFDMDIQLNPMSSAPEVDEGTKIAVYLNSASNLVVVSGTSENDKTAKTNVTTTTVNPGAWVRLTISKADGNSFKVHVNDTQVGVYYSLTGEGGVAKIGFQGSGALDNFVARTTDPHRSTSYGASICTVPGYEGSDIEKYGNLWEAVVDTLTDVSGPKSIKTANSFYDGTEDNPYEIHNAACLKALADGVLVNPAVRSLNFVQNDDIDMTGVEGFYGIGWFRSSDKYASLPAGLASASTDVPFTGVYDGNNFKISNVTLVRHNYAGVFNNVEGTVKNLTVENLGFSGTCTEWGCAIVGNAQGDAVLENLTSAGTVWGNDANHNVAGTVVRAQNAVTIRRCVNNAPITSVSRRLGGIIAFTGSTAPTGTITIDSCTNNAALTVNTGTNAGDRGIGGIISRPESIADGLVIRNCANFGVLTNNGTPAKVGGIAGELNSQNYVDGGGNTFLVTLGPVGNYNSKTVTGLAYAVPTTIGNEDYLTTVAQDDLAAGGTYTLVADVAASETPVFTLENEGAFIAFDFNGHEFNGTIAAAAGLRAAVTVDDITTYTAEVFSWASYLGDPVGGAYEIDSLAELKLFQQGVAEGLATSNETFKLTADIALDEAWKGIGVKAGKDLVNHASGTAQATIDEDLNKFIAGAFSGTFDGGNRTISNFQMENDTDYGGFFNSVNDATIKNLKVSYKENKLCANSSATGGDTGATFVGVARNSTLQNLTALATEEVATVSASKDMAGIVAYLMAGSTVDSCTNELNVASLLTAKARKSGGIALITQEGTGTATIRNCKNSGTVTLANAGGQAGGIVGYVGQSTTIIDCENTAAVKLLTRMGNNTVTLQGVNKGNATVASYTGAATPGLNFATVDGDVATFVADDALVNDGTYKVMNDNAAYAFATAGTLALDQSLAAATVTADTSKFVLTASEPVDDVTTYTAVAGVASVGGQAYATMQDAIDNAGNNDVITILPGIDQTQRYNVFNRGGTFKFAYDTDYIALFMNGLLTADGFILQGMPVTESEDTVLVYSVVEGVAKMNSTWYASFESAYYAAPGSGATLLVKVDSDFTPTFPQASQNEVLKEFASVTFTTTSEEPIAIATSDGTTFIKSQNWSAPETATLTLASQTIASVATGTLNIPEGTTLAVASGASFANVGAITGAGVLSAVGLNPVTALQTDHVAALLADSAKWTGVVVLGDVSLGTDSLDYYGNVNSTVRLSNVNVNSLVIAGRSNNVKSLDVAGNGLTFNELAANTTIPCALTGDGSIVVKGSVAQQKVLSFTGDCSEFAGSLTIDNANGVAKVLFGTKNTVGNGSCLTVGSDASVKVASGKTWTVPGGYVINGSVKADGALNTADKIYGSGTITSTVAQTSKVGGSWSGTYNICWAGDNNTGISFDWYGQANSKIVIPANHTLQGFIAVTANQSLTLAAGEFVVDGVLNLSNGYDYSTVGWKKISGSGTLKFAFAPSHWIKEKIGMLDGFTGSIEVSTTTQLEIAGVRVAAAPEAGARVVPITVNGSGTVGGDLKLYVGDEVQDVTLEFKADGAEGSGLYVAEPPAAKVAEIVGGDQFETLAGALAAATDGATVKLLDNITLDARVDSTNTSLTIDLGGYTITREGTSGNGSVFDVKSGNVVITNGVIDCTQDDAAIVADGVYAITARSGANVTLGGLTITVDSQAGACVYPFDGATVKILGGTYRNNTAVEYQYHADWTGMAVNQANVATQLITIYGGSFYQVNPALGDDSGLATTFLASGYQSAYNSETGYWIVSKKTGPSIVDGDEDPVDVVVDGTTIKVDPETAATAITVSDAEGYTIEVPVSVDQVSGVADANIKVVSGANDITGAFSITDGAIVLDENGSVTINEETIAVKPTFTDAGDETVPFAVGDDVSVGVKTIPGLTYTLKRGTSLGTYNDEVAEATATGTRLSLTDNSAEKPTTAFYVIEVTK